MEDNFESWKQNIDCCSNLLELKEMGKSISEYEPCEDTKIKLRPFFVKKQKTLQSSGQK
jgi:hypothetical protein